MRDTNLRRPWLSAQFLPAAGLVSHAVVSAVVREISANLTDTDGCRTQGMGATDAHAAALMDKLIRECESVFAVGLRASGAGAPHDLEAVAGAVIAQRSVSSQEQRAAAVLSRAAPSELRIAEAEWSRGASSRFTTGATFRIEGMVDIEKMNRALATVGRRHPLLRSSYSGSPGDLRRTVHADAGDHFAFVCLRDASRARESADALRQSRFTHTYRLTDPTLWDLLLVQVDDEEWQLTWTFHHILVDQYSVSLLVDDLFETYGPPSREPGAETARVDQAFLDFSATEWTEVLHQRSGSLTSDWLEAHGELEVGLVERISDVPGSQSSAIEAECEAVRSLGVEDSAEIRRIAGAGGVTVGAVVLAGWQLTLANFCGSTRVTTCVPVSRRLQANLVEGVGYADITLPITSSWSATTQVRDLLRETLDELDFLSRNGSLVADGLSRGGRDVAGRLDSFDSLLAMGGSRAAPGKVDGLSFGVLDKPRLPLEYPVEVEVILGHEIHVLVRMDHNRFSDQTCAALADYYLSILRALPHTEQVGDVPWTEITTARFSTDTPVLKHPLHSIESKVTESGARDAIIDGDVQLTYQELWDSAGLVAASVPEELSGPVAVLVDDRVDIIIAVLGISLSGLPFAVLDPRNTSGVLVEQILQAGVSAVVADAANASRLEGRVRVISPAPSEGISPSRPSRRRPLDLDEPAYVVFTSGTTGRPKAILAPWSTLATAVAHDAERNPLTGEVLSISSIGFDVFLLEIFATLTQGGTIRVLEALSPSAVAGCLIQYPVSKIFIGPTLLRAVAEDLLRHTGPLSLRYLLVSGDRLTVDGPIRRLLDANPQLLLENQYGPSETHHATSARFEPVAAVDTHPPIGGPISGVSVVALDAFLNEVPLGAVGDAYVAGTGVTAGYLGGATQTAERYVPLRESGVRAYRTGDIVRRMWDGTYRFLGRSDAEVKVNGFRIDPRAVEDALRSIPGVREAGVLAETGRQGAGLLVAGVVTDELTHSAAALRRALSMEIPRFMVPSVIHFFDDSLPVNANGKLDLVQVADRPRPVSGESSTPLNGPQFVLALAILEVLDLDFAPLEENYFEVGGSSLQLPVVAQRARLLGGTEVPTWEIMEGSGVREVALSESLGSWTPDDGAHTDDGLLIAVLPSEHGTYDAFEELVEQLEPPLRVVALSPLAEMHAATLHEAITAWVQQLVREASSKVVILATGLAAPVAHAIATELLEAGRRVDIVYVPSRTAYVESDSSAISSVRSVLPDHARSYVDFGTTHEYRQIDCRLLTVTSRTVAAEDLALFQGVTRRHVAQMTPPADPMDALTFPSVELFTDDVRNFLKERS